MERTITALCLITFVVSPLAASENSAVDIGAGVHNNRGSNALFMRYADDFRQSWFIGQNFYEWSLGVWDGKARNDGVGFSLGSRGHWDRYYLNGSVGVAYLEHKTELSGTHQQF